MMDSLSHILKSTLRYTFLFAALVLVLLSSCFVKNSIKIFAGVPTHTAGQNMTLKGNHSLFSNNAEHCTYGETVENAALQPTSVDNINLLPAVLFATAFFLTPFSIEHQQVHPIYENLAASGILPIFLRHRQILI